MILRHWAGGTAVAVAVAALVSACGGAGAPSDPRPGHSGFGSGSRGTVPARAVASRAPATPPLPFGTVSRPGVAPTPVAVGRLPADPVRVRIPAIGVDSGLERLGLLHDRSLAPPARWAEAGWYAGGVVPGRVGPALIAGHVDSTAGPAVFFRLRELHRGDLVRVTDRRGRVLTFEVDGSRHYAKAHFPTSTVYAATPDAQLRLITCTGAFDVRKHSYVDNLVVSAHLVRG